LIETGHKLFKGHQQQTVFLSVSLKPIALNNSEPNEIKDCHDLMGTRL
jgi:hypothetical protein